MTINEIPQLHQLVAAKGKKWLNECGFDLIKDLSDEYSGTGSSYYIMQKL